MSYARFQMPVALRKIVFFLPGKYHKFSVQGLLYSVYTHILLILSVIRIGFGLDNMRGILDTSFDMWVFIWLFYMILYTICFYMQLIFGEKKCIKKNKVKQVLFQNEFVHFKEFKIIKEAVVSENIRNSKNGVVLILPTSILIDYKGTLVGNGNDDSYISTYGNYDLLSSFFYEKGYACIRINFEKNVEEYGYFKYVEEVVRMIKILDKEYNFGNNLMFFAHGPIGSVTALDVMDEIPIKRIIMFGGANVTPFEDLYQHLKFDGVIREESELFEGQLLFGQEIFSMRSKGVLKKVENISVPTLVVFTSEEIFYNPKLVKELEQIKNHNMTVKRLFGVAGVGVEYDLSKCIYRIIEVRNDKVLNLCKRVRKTLGEWLDKRICGGDYI